MAFHKCNCMFIPTQVLENLARAGVDEARASILQSEKSRQLRAAKVSPPPVSKRAIAPPGEGPRSVYDCQHEWTKRVALARKEGGPVTADDDTTDVYKYAGIVSEYFKDVLSRNSYDNAGSDIILNVHHGVHERLLGWR